MLTPADLVRRFYDVVWNAANEDVAREILAPKFRFRASLGPEREGPEGFIQYMRAIHAALGSYTCTIEDLLTDGSRASARMTFSGVHRAEFFGVPATAKRITWAGAAFFDTEAGQITRLWVLGDIDAVKRQLGAEAKRDF
jgi:steroid delta-isomerase-like uncharacterized protein